MDNYIHGWRPKFGAATLAMACILLIGWVRSQTLIELLDLNTRPTRFLVISFDGVLYLSTTDYMDTPKRPLYLFSSSSPKGYAGLYLDKNQVTRFDPALMYEHVNWRYDCGGIHFSKGVIGGGGSLKMELLNCWGSLIGPSLRRSH